MISCYCLYLYLTVPLTRCTVLVQNDTLCRVFSGLVQTCQLPVVVNFNTERIYINQFHLSTWAHLGHILVHLLIRCTKLFRVVKLRRKKEKTLISYDV